MLVAAFKDLGPGPAAADDDDSIEDSGSSALVPLRLLSFSSMCYMPASVIGALPSTLTTLQLIDSPAFAPVSAYRALHTAIASLSSLRDVSLRRGGVLRLPWTQGLESVTQITRLDTGRLLSGDAPTLPVSLVSLKLMFEADIRPGGAASNSNSLDAARHLYLTHLTRLQCAELRAAHTSAAVTSAMESAEADFNWRDGEGKDLYSDAVTLHLPAQAQQQLTRLLLEGNFEEVMGLPGPCKLQELSLRGCSITAGRLAELVAGMPDLRDVFYCADEFNREDPDESVSAPMIRPTQPEVEQLAAALGAATQLTSLRIEGLSTKGGGGDDANALQAPGVWGQHLRNLRQLRHLELDDHSAVYMSTTEALQLTVLTALTTLQLDGMLVAERGSPYTTRVDVVGEVWDELRKHCTQLPARRQGYYGVQCIPGW